MNTNSLGGSMVASRVKTEGQGCSELLFAAPSSPENVLPTAEIGRTYFSGIIRYAQSG